MTGKEVVQYLTKLTPTELLRLRNSVKRVDPDAIQLWIAYGLYLKCKEKKIELTFLENLLDNMIVKYA